MLIHDALKDLLGIAPALVIKCNLPQAKLQLREELVGRRRTSGAEGAEGR
jgi:hypothetical protein